VKSVLHLGSSIISSFKLPSPVQREWYELGLHQFREGGEYELAYHHICKLANVNSRFSYSDESTVNDGYILTNSEFKS
jgi:hypothetical protein